MQYTTIKPIFLENSHVVLLEAPDFILERVDVKLYTFKEAKDHFKRLIDLEKAQIKKNEEQVREWKNTPPFCSEETEKFMEEVHIGKRELIRQYEKMLNRFDMRKKHTENKEDLNIEMAKRRLVTEFIDFNKAGFAKCLWHNEKTGSLKYYDKTNSVYCFSCQEHHDVIDVVSKLHGVSFKEAIYYLTR